VWHALAYQERVCESVCAYYHVCCVQCLTNILGAVIGRVTHVATHRLHLCYTCVSIGYNYVKRLTHTLYQVYTIYDTQYYFWKGENDEN
jgi:hypothetical protein